MTVMKDIKMVFISLTQKDGEKSEEILIRAMDIRKVIQFKGMRFLILSTENIDNIIESIPEIAAKLEEARLKSVPQFQISLS